MTPKEKRESALRERIRIDAYDHLSNAQDVLTDKMSSDASARCAAALSVGAALALLSLDLSEES